MPAAACGGQGVEYDKLTDDRLGEPSAAVQQLGMSARAFTRILKLARTIADLEGVEEIKTHHLAEALQHRPRRA